MKSVTDMEKNNEIPLDMSLEIFSCGSFVETPKEFECYICGKKASNCMSYNTTTVLGGKEIEKYVFCRKHYCWYVQMWYGHYEDAAIKRYKIINNKLSLWDKIKSFFRTNEPTKA